MSERLGGSDDGPRRDSTATADPAKRGGRVRRFLIPATYDAHPGAVRSLVRTLVIALLIRLPLMPIAAHVDLVSTYHRSYLILHDFHPRYWVPHEILQAMFLILYSPFLALSDLLGWGIDATASFEFWVDSFIQHPQIHWALFLFKVPYLLCDVAIASILLRFFAKEPAKGVKAASLWLLNPIAIFGFYVFARHDAVTILFVVLGLWSLQRSWFIRGALSIGVAIWARYYPVFYLPFLYATVTGDWKRKARTVAIALVPVLAFNVFVVLAETTATAAGDVANPGRAPLMGASSSNFASYLVNFYLDMGWKQILFVFPASAVALVLYAFTVEQRARASGWVLRFVEYCAAFLLVLYATSFFHPQYFTWFLPFLVILRAQSSSPVLRNLHYLQILMFVPYTFFWGRPLFGYLFASIDPAYFTSLPAPWDWIAQFGPPKILLNLVRSAMTATCLFMAGWILWSRREEFSAPAQDRTGVSS